MTDSKIETTSYRKHKRSCLIGMLILSACSGVISGWCPDYNVIIDFIICVPFLFLNYAWCHYDALEQGYFMSKIMRICIVLFLFVAFPVYIFKTRGLGGFKTLGFSLLFVGASIVTSILSGLSSYFVKYLIGQ